MKQISKLILFIIIIAAVITIIGRIFFFDFGRTANYSMAPTIIPGDIFIFRTVGLLGRGDIAVCSNPDDPSSLVIGRIIGVPGDGIEISNNHIVSNGRMIHHSYVEPVLYFDNTTEESMKYVVRVAEEKIGGNLYEVAFMDSTNGKNFRKTVIPDGHFFIVGDNRNMAHDSRNFGTVPIESCLGEVMFILWASENNGDLKQSKRSFSWI